MKSICPTVYVCLGGRVYAVDCQVLHPRAAAHAGADSPRFLDPGSPPRVQVLRILRDQVDVTGELFCLNKVRIVEEAQRQALQSYYRLQHRSHTMRRKAPRARRRIA